MATTYHTYTATIPAKFAEVADVEQVTKFLRVSGLLNVGANGDIHFGGIIEGDNDPGSYQLRHAGPATIELYSIAQTALQKLIRENRVCLSYVGCRCSSDSFDEPESFDPVEVAERIPTLILQEVLAKRLASL